MARRAQLAVVAHVRHVYTMYDKLLKSGTYGEARAAVEQPCLDKLVSWRGDDENGTTVLEDVFREVVVISDSEDDSEGDAQDDHTSIRESSVEFVSSKPSAHQVQMVPIQYGSSATKGAERLRDDSDEELDAGYQYISRSTRKRKAPDQQKLERRGFHRYNAWSQAIDRYRQDPNRSIQTTKGVAANSAIRTGRVEERRPPQTERVYRRSHSPVRGQDMLPPPPRTANAHNDNQCSSFEFDSVNSSYRQRPYETFAGDYDRREVSRLRLQNSYHL